jgi:hypothetical protein
MRINQIQKLVELMNRQQKKEAGAIEEARTKGRR